MKFTVNSFRIDETLARESNTKNPEVDVLPFLKGASSNFRKYIEEGLAEIERQRCQEAGGDNKIDSNLVSSTTSRTATNKQDPDYWLEKLNNLRSDLSPARSREISNMSDNRVTDENLNLNQLPHKLVSMHPKEKVELSPHRLEHLQQKLAQIKQQRQT